MDAKRLTYQADSLIRFSPGLSRKDWVLKPDDVLFMARGVRNYSVLISDIPDSTLAAACFFIVRVSSDQVLPHYLWWYLNQAPVDYHLERYSGRGVHMLATAQEGKGRVGVVVPHGVLFRGGQEGKIRETVIRENLLDGVIGLPANLFYGTGIPAALMIFDKSRKPNGKGNVLFIDAGREFAQNTNQNKLRPQDIDKIVDTFQQLKTIDKYSYIASYAEIEENEFNLNIPRYVDTFEPEEEIDIAGVQQEIEQIEAELVETQKKMNKYLKELGF